MSVEQNKALVRKNLDLLNNKQLDAALEQLCASFEDHAVQPRTPAGPEGVKIFFTMAYSAFPDMHGTLEDLVAEGDKVVTRNTLRATHSGTFLGIPPTGKQVEFSLIDIYRLVNGKIAAHWGLTDMLGLMQQLGIVPPPRN
jgi:steroid delta-isomerase-like uncharacterized protein